MFWVSLLIWAIGTLVMELIRPKPNFEDARPAGLGDFSFPTATEGRSVPVAWGKVKITGPNVIWFGGLRQVAITENVKTGLFSSSTVTTGYRYYVGLHFALCRGEDVTLHRFEVNEKMLLDGTWNGDNVRITASKHSILGGEEFGSGGMSGVFAFFSGSKTQGLNAYLSGKQTPNIAYRGTCHGVWEGGWVGNSPSIPPYAFVVSRIPDGLGLATSNPGAEEPYSGGCNPMNVLYEILTDTDWGLHVPTSDVDLTNFRSVADTLYSEGNGFAMLLDSPKKVEDIIREVERQIDGTLYFDRANALWRVKLARNDYTVSSLLVFDESNIVELVDYTRQTWEETTNQVRVKYTDSAKNWQQTYALAQDLANASIQNSSVSAESSYPGCQNATLANQLAWRDLRVLAFPLGKINLKVNREAFSLIPGSVFKFSNARLGIADVVYRVSKINPGNIDSDVITIFAVQDVFAAGVGVFSDPIASGWVDEPQAAVAPISADTLAVEAPRQLVAKDTYSPDLQPRIWMGARWPGGGTINFRVTSRTGSSRPLSSSYTEEDTRINAFLLAGKLDSAIAGYGSAASRPDASYNIDVAEDPDTLSSLEVAGNATLVSSLLTIIYIDGEYIGYETLTDLGTGVVRLAKLYRGLFHTAPKSHAANTRVWFVGQTGGNLGRVLVTGATDEVDVKLLSQDSEATMAEGDVPTEEVSLDFLWLCPLAPRDPLLHGSFAPASASLDTQYLTETGELGDDARALKVAITPRAWRVDDPLLDTDLGQSSPAYLDDSPEFDFVLVLDPSGTPVTLGSITVSGTETPVAYILRDAVIVAVGANAGIPSTGKIRVTAKHTIDSTEYTNPVDMEFGFTITSTLLDDDLLHGGLDVNVAGAAVTYGETGSYSFDIGHTALPSSGILEASINSGSYATIVAASNTTGTLPVTAGDSVVLRFTQAPTSDQYFAVTGPTEVGHGVLKA